MFEPVSPNYYISIISDRWLHSKTRLPISFKHLLLPESSLLRRHFLVDNLPLYQHSTTRSSKISIHQCHRCSARSTGASLPSSHQSHQVHM
jgi:hypothetical protein